MFNTLPASIALLVAVTSALGAAVPSSDSDNVAKVILNPITGRTGAYFKGAAHVDRVRASLKKGSTSGDATINARQSAYVSYTASIGVGNPPTYYELVIDTGSSNTFVGTGKQYVITNTSVPTDQSVNVTYGIGYFVGDEYFDQVTLAPNLVLQNQSIGDALQSASFEGVDGIIGVGPADLTVGTLSPDVNSTIPTVMDNALSQGLITSEVLGVSFAPSHKYNDTNGYLTFGGVDNSLYIGDITYTPVTSTSPSNFYWGINITGATYSNKKVIDGSYAGIVDTGTTLIVLADDWFKIYQDAIPGAYYDSNNTGLIVIPEESVSSIKPFHIEIAGKRFTLDAQAQLLPKDQNEAWGAEEGLQYGYITPSGDPSGEGLDFILGQKFMERFYAVFDTDNQQVGFAYTEHTYSS